MTATVLNVSDAEYYADPCPTPSLSASIAHVLISQSPLHAYARHPRLGGEPRKPTDATDRGIAMHALLLDENTDSVEVLDVDSFRSKEARAARDLARKDGNIPLKRADYEELDRAVVAIREKLGARGIDLDRGEHELALEWTEQSESRPVQCRGKLDILHRDKRLIQDVKFVRSANPKDVARHVLNYGADIQSVAYRRAVAELLGLDDWKLEVRFEFIFCEPEPPHGVFVCRLSSAFSELGWRKWCQAVEIWGRCLKEQSWPDYGCPGVPLEPPTWAFSDWEAA